MFGGVGTEKPCAAFASRWESPAGAGRDPPPGAEPLRKRTKEEHTIRKALIYGLTLTFALTLTACGQPRAEEPGAPDPAASAAVQTVSPETTEPTATPAPSEETPTAPVETDAQPAEDTAPEEIPAEQDPEDPGETVTTQPTEETETEAKPETIPTTKPTQPSGTAQTPPSSSEDMSAADQAILEAVRRNKEQRAKEGYNSGHGNLTDDAMEAIGSALSGGTPTTQPDTSSQGSTDQTQTPPDSGSVESDNVRTPAQTAAEDWIRQQLTGGSSDYTGGRDFTEEEIADIGSKLNVTN